MNTLSSQFNTQDVDDLPPRQYSGLERLPWRVVFAQLPTKGLVISATGHGFTQTWWIAAIAIVAIAFGRMQPSPTIAKSG